MRKEIFPIAESIERDLREILLNDEYPGFPNCIGDVDRSIEILKEFGLYCEFCKHGFGCDHGIPAANPF